MHGKIFGRCAYHQLVDSSLSGTDRCEGRSPTRPQGTPCKLLSIKTLDVIRTDRREDRSQTGPPETPCKLMSITERIGAVSHGGSCGRGDLICVETDLSHVSFPESANPSRTDVNGKT